VKDVVNTVQLPLLRGIKKGGFWSGGDHAIIELASPSVRFFFWGGRMRVATLLLTVADSGDL
jgi:hypothetical protein